MSPGSSTPGEARQRLFFALWPDAAVREALTNLARRALRRARGKAVAAENYHITLLFLGTVAPRLRACAEGVADAISVSAFTLRLDRLGYWPRPRVLWTAPGDTPPELAALATSLRRGLLACGVDPEKRPFSAHLTLARKVGHGVAAPHDSIVWPVDAFHLVESRTHRAGAQYGIVRSWPLTGGAPTASGTSVSGSEL